VEDEPHKPETQVDENTMGPKRTMIEESAEKCVVDNVQVRRNSAAKSRCSEHYPSSSIPLGLPTWLWLCCRKVTRNKMRCQH